MFLSFFLPSWDWVWKWKFGLLTFWAQWTIHVQSNLTINVGVFSKQLIYVYHMILTINNILSLYSFNNQRAKHTLFFTPYSVKNSLCLLLVLPPLNTLSTWVTLANPFKLHLLKPITQISITRAVSANKLSDTLIIWHQLIVTFQYCILWSCIYTMSPRDPKP
jgi:hypothetical protein